MTEYRWIDGMFTSKIYKPGITFPYQVGIPEKECEEYALLVEHDGPNPANNNAIMKLADEGKAPYTVCLGVFCGRLCYPDGTERKMRMNSYDQFNREYADFLVYELIPHVMETTGVRISADADLHAISGGSSGGISAFCVAWFRSEYFHRVYMASPSFLAMGRGNEVPYLVKKCEPKPLRIYEEYSEDEPDEYFGSSYPVGMAARNALQFAKYDFKCVYFPGEGHCSRYSKSEEEALVRMQWLWRNWQTEPIRVKDASHRVKKVVPFGDTWVKCDTFPTVSQVGSKDYDLLLDAPDGKMRYGAKLAERYVWSFPDFMEPEPKNALTHAMLHEIPGDRGGLLGLAMDECERLYALTACGIQCIRPFGLIDVILSLPDDSQPLEIAVTDGLYVKTAKGCYRRNLVNCIGQAQRLAVDYYDD